MKIPPRSRTRSDGANVSALLIAWYEKHSRDLPWRQNADPYRVWVSEIMLQQTRVDTVLRYYERFLQAFPNIETLAVASDDQLLLRWEGLGYYRRARNLREGARLVADEWLAKQDRWPQTAEEWIQLPGIGRYTAAAISSICFDHPNAVVDGNVKRVLARLFCIDTPVNSTAGEKELWRLADELITSDRPGDHNQAVMELGATVCTPKNPHCRECPLSDICLALLELRMDELPVKTPKKPIPHHKVAAAVIRNDDGAILIQRRPDDGMLGGLWELPCVMLTGDESPLERLREHITSSFGVDKLEIGEPIAQARHVYSHFSIDATAYPITCSIPTQDLETPDLRWMLPVDRSQFAMHRAHDKLLIQLWDPQQKLHL
jgi:A/G-specific adenine glycosylase